MTWTCYFTKHETIIAGDAQLGSKETKEMVSKLLPVVWNEGLNCRRYLVYPFLLLVACQTAVVQLEG